MKSREERLNDFDDACRKAGLRVTQQRLEIYRELMAATDHPSAESLHQRIRMPTPSLDTVYRNFAALVRGGLINKVETAGELFKKLNEVGIRFMDNEDKEDGLWLKTRGSRGRRRLSKC
jgi:Fur family peroxide stress response transcriptional regulator